jgi:hypothetical protein
MRGLVYIFVKPKEFFAELKYSPKVLVPFIALVIMFIIFNLCTLDIIVKPRVERLQAQGIDFEELEATGKHPILKLKILSFFFKNFPILIRPFLLAFFSLILANILVPGIKYKQVLSVILYGEVLYGVGKTLKGFIMLLKDSSDVSISPAPIGELFGYGPATDLFSLLSNADFFLIWEIIVVAIGFSIFLKYALKKCYILSILSVGLIPSLSMIFILLKM